MRELKARYSLETIDDLKEKHGIPNWSWSYLLPWNMIKVKHYYTKKMALRDLRKQVANSIKGEIYGK